MSLHPRAEGSKVLCQLEVLPSSGRAPAALATRGARANRLLLRAALRLKKAVRDPALLLRRFRERRPTTTPIGSTGGPDTEPPARDLRPGDRVRVRSCEEINATLDSDGRFERLTYIPAVMDRFSGGTYTVRKCIDEFFDERTYRMVKLKRTVILDTVFCEPEAHLDCDWAGCKRTCFLFWKEGWLVRAPESQPTSDEVTHVAG